MLAAVSPQRTGRSRGRCAAAPRARPSRFARHPAPALGCARGARALTWVRSPLVFLSLPRLHHFLGGRARGMRVGVALAPCQGGWLCSCLVADAGTGSEPGETESPSPAAWAPVRNRGGQERTAVLTCLSRTGCATLDSLTSEHLRLGSARTGWGQRQTPSDGTVGPRDARLARVSATAPFAQTQALAPGGRPLPPPLRAGCAMGLPPALGNAGPRTFASRGHAPVTRGTRADAWRWDVTLRSSRKQVNKKAEL